MGCMKCFIPKMETPLNAFKTRMHLKRVSYFFSRDYVSVLWQLPYEDLAPTQKTNP